MIKKLLPYLVGIIIAIGIFIGGFYFGIYTVASMKSSSMLEDNLIQSTQTMSVLNYLDEGKVDLARQYLLLNLDSTIISINSIANYADKKSYETACNILKVIARHRKDNAAKYSEYTYPV